MSEPIVFSVLGIGPGESSYRLPLADETVEGADLLIGGERHLALFRHLGKEEICLAGRIKELSRIIEVNWLSKRIAVLVSGDPGFYSLLGLVSRHFPPDRYRVIPGISSLQLAAARTGFPWQEDLFLSLHGREPKQWLSLTEEALEQGRRVFFLTDRTRSPLWIGRCLVASGRDRPGGTKVVLFHRLGHRDEMIIETTLEDLVAKPDIMEGRDELWVMVIAPA